MTIKIYLELPDYEDKEYGTQLCNSIRLDINEQGPRISWQEIVSIRENYIKVLEFLLPTQFYESVESFQIRIHCNEPYFNPFFTPISHVTKVEAEGFMLYDSRDDYYRANDLL